MIEFVLFIGGVLLLVKGADFLVESASSLAKKLNISDLIIGLTIVAFGTSVPELSVNVFSSLNGQPEIAIGNILGSNIANVLLILGITAIIFPVKVTKNTALKEIPLSILAAVMVWILANDAIIHSGSMASLNWIDGLVLLAFFAGFLFYIFQTAKKRENTQTSLIEPKKQSMHSAVFFILLGLCMLAIGGNIAVTSAVHIAQSLGVSQSLIGLTVVAVGTSLPELATSAVAAFRKNSDIAIGNIVGSNIFNIFFILGISALISPLPFTAKTVNTDILMAFLSSVLLFIALYVGKRHILQRWQGIGFLIIYAGYLGFLVMNG